MRSLLLASLSVVAFGCGQPKVTGRASVETTIPGYSLTSQDAYSIARTMPPNGEIMIATTALACLTVDTSDHVTIDLGALTTGSFKIVPGYPLRTNLDPTEARAHACPAYRTKLPCDQEVVGGEVVISRFDLDGSGVVEGTFDVKFADGEIKGTFSAPRCD